MKTLTITSSDGARRASALLVRHTARVSANLRRAIEVMHEQQAGYPARASGANLGGGGQRTITADGDQVPVTGVEAAAITGGPDTASTDLDALYALLARAELDLGQAASIVDRYADGRLGARDRGTVREDLGDIWCPNCAAHGHFVGRADGRRLCGWCDQFTRANGFTPDAQLLALHHQGRRVLEGDLAAARARHLATQQEAKRVTKAQRRAKRDTAQDGSAA